MLLSWPHGDSWWQPADLMQKSIAELLNLLQTSLEPSASRRVTNHSASFVSDWNPSNWMSTDLWAFFFRCSLNRDDYNQQVSYIQLTYVTMSSASRHNICLYKSCTTGKQKHLGPSEPVAHPTNITNITIPTIPSKLRPEKEQQKSSSTMPKPQETNWINIIASWWRKPSHRGHKAALTWGRSGHVHEIVIGKYL